MKKGKIILGVVAVIVTAVSSLAIKAASKFSAHGLYYQFTDGGGSPRSFAAASNAFKCTQPGGCLIINGATVNGVQLPATHLYALRTVNRIVCQGPTDYYADVL